MAYMWNLEKMVEMNLIAKQKQSYRCRDQRYGYQGRKRGWMNWETGAEISTLLCIKQTNENFLFSTGISIHCSVVI